VETPERSEAEEKWRAEAERRVPGVKDYRCDSQHPSGLVQKRSRGWGRLSFVSSLCQRSVISFVFRYCHDLLISLVRLLSSWDRPVGRRGASHLPPSRGLRTCALLLAYESSTGAPVSPRHYDVATLRGSLIPLYRSNFSTRFSPYLHRPTAT
jgi:hypothetical protein